MTIFTKRRSNCVRNTHTRQGNITVIDALVPFYAVLSSNASLEDAVMAVKEALRKLEDPGNEARLERALYVGGWRRKGRCSS